MSSTRPELTGYAVTVEVFVPAEVADRAVDRLDRSWHNESWTPKAAAHRIVREALEGAGLQSPVDLDVREVVR